MRDADDPDDVAHYSPPVKAWYAAIAVLAALGVKPWYHKEHPEAK